jgi:hypothetical protein
VFATPFSVVAYLGLTAAICFFLAVGAQGQSAPASGPTSQPVNLVYNGDFEKADDADRLPDGWSTEHPANAHLAHDVEGHGQVVEMTGDQKLMGSYGVDLLSGKIPVKPETRYHCTGTTRSTGPRMKVFVRGYATVPRRVRGEVTVFDDAVYTMRKDIAPSAQWQPFQLDFEIRPAEVVRDQQHAIKYVRIKLWAYWPMGTCWFDDIRFQEVGPREGEAGESPAETRFGPAKS